MRAPSKKLVWRLSSKYLSTVFWAVTLSLAMIQLGISQTVELPPNAWQLKLQYRVETKPHSGRFHTLFRQETWDPSRTAVIVCDVGDTHHSINTFCRVEELAPQIDPLIRQARSSNATVIHAPSECMASYVDHPARQRAVKVARSGSVPSSWHQGCQQIDAEQPFPYPIDQSDDGKDDDLTEHSAWAKELESKGRNARSPGKKPIHLIAIDEQRDFISDYGPEIWSILESRQIDNVILCGVHTNLAVLGRPLGLRNMAAAGKRPVLVRNWMDAMYNPERWPFVYHHTGTDLIVEYIEKCICPTITSDQVVGGRPFRFQSDRRPLIAIVMPEEEYETNQKLPKFAADFLGQSFRVSFVFSHEDNPNALPGLEIVNAADVVLLSVRRRLIPPEQLECFRKYAKSGKPMVGIRTASHAFSSQTDQSPAGLEGWPDFHAQVWGGNYSGHHGNDFMPTISISSTLVKHPILSGISWEHFFSNGSLYKTNPLAARTQVLLTGAIASHPPEPVAWTFERADGGRAFYTSLGHKDDFKNPAFQRLLCDGLAWASGIDQAEVPQALPFDSKNVEK